MPRAEAITSARNPLLKEIRRALAKGSLTAAGLCVAETFHLLEEALRSGCDTPVVLAGDSVRPAVEKRVRGLRAVRLYAMPDALFQEISATESAQGVMALVRPPEWTLDHLFRGRSLVVILDGLQDPGNAGTIVRAAEAFGATGMMFLKGAVSPFNPKTIRASAGSLFRVPFLHGLDADLARAACEQRRVDLWATVPGNGKPVDHVDLTRRCAFLVGSEGHGVSEALRQQALPMHIPTGGVESLNVSVAAGVLLFEAARQRRAAGELKGPR